MWYIYISIPWVLISFFFIGKNGFFKKLEIMEDIADYGEILYNVVGAKIVPRILQITLFFNGLYWFLVTGKNGGKCFIIRLFCLYSGLLEKP